MMKFYIALLLCVSVWSSSYGNVDYIRIDKITKDPVKIKYFNFIKDNKKYFDQWVPEWKYEQPKAVLVAGLKEAYVSFATFSPENTELQLLLGDISHYLYNLEVKESFSRAEDSYNLAIKSSPDDIRGRWFLARHYSLSNEPAKAIAQFTLAQKINLDSYAGAFWGDYAYAATLAGMPSTVLFAVKKAKLALGKLGVFEDELGQVAARRLIDVDANHDYKSTEIWEASKGEMVTFVSRPLGLKLLLDSNWGINVLDYKKRVNVFVMTPPAIKNKAGKNVGYTLLMMGKVIADGEELESYIGNLVAKYPTKQKIDFSKRYNRMVAYEIKDKNMYTNLGGGHLYAVGIERSAPEDPGLLLEQAVTLPMKTAGQLTYFTAGQSKRRFDGKIFYAFLLDSCEDIHEQSLEVFRSFMEKQLFVE